MCDFFYIHNFIVSKKVQWGPAASSFNLGNAVPLQYYFTIQYNWSNNRANNMASIKVGHKLVLITIHFIISFEDINCLYKNIKE